MVSQAFRPARRRRLATPWLGIVLILRLLFTGASSTAATPASARDVAADPDDPECPRINDAIGSGKGVEETADDVNLPIATVRRCVRLRELGEWIERSLDAGTGPVVPHVRALLDQLPHTWQASRCRLQRGDTSPIVESDLDADGSSSLLIALNVDGDVHWDQDRPRVSEWAPDSGLFFVRQAGGKHRVTLVRETGDNVSLVAAADLIGDGRREIVWSESDQGAHTCMIAVFVSVWDDRRGTLRRVPGDISLPSPTGFEIAGRDLVISGGLIASAGAGRQQRNHADRYRIEGGRVRLVDRRFEPSEFAYDRLIDGIQADSSGHTAEALRAFREAAEPERPLLRATAPGDPAEERLRPAVRAFARFRIGALLLTTDREAARQALAAEDGSYAGLTRTMLDAGDRAAGCAAAADWVARNRRFLGALNPAIGYANPCWGPRDVCGPLPADWDHCSWRGRFDDP